MDILAALDAAPARTGGKCVVQRFLDNIPDDQPGKDALVAIIETTDKHEPTYRTILDVLGILAKLGLTTTDTTYGEHRRKQCRCYR